MALQLDFTQHIVNVHWGEAGFHFLYSGADGMFGSSDGVTWTQAPSSQPAVSLAWVDDVWVGCGPDGCWRSEDGAESWTAVDAPAFFEVVAMKPSGLGPDGEPKRGVFAGWLEDEEGDNHIVYTSHDLGETWEVALTIPTTVDESGSESIRSLSGCGGALFVCTSWHSQTFHAGDGKIYSSTDGHSFAEETVFGPGSVILPENPDQYPRIGILATAVGYDAESETYIAIGDKEIIPAFGMQETYLVYTTSTTTSFGEGFGTVADSATNETGVGEFLSVARSAAGGDGKHVAGSYLFQNGPGGSYISGALKAAFIPGTSDTVESMGSSAGGYIGSFCFKSSSETESTDTDGGEGIFACAAFDAEKAGGVYIAASGGGFARTHSGTAIAINGQFRGAVAVGKVGFLGANDAGL